MMSSWVHYIAVHMLFVDVVCMSSLLGFLINVTLVSEKIIF